MEDTHKEEEEKDIVAETTDTSSETQTDASEETKEESTDIDYKKELEELEGTKPSKSELEKAKRALYFNAQRYSELGGDPSDVLPKPKAAAQPETDVDKVIDLKFAEREARALAKTEDEYQLIVWRVKNQGLSVSEAHLLANKGKLLKLSSELKRADVKPSLGGGAGQRILEETVPERNAAEVQLLTRRGMQFNPKTNTWQGKYTEEYWNGSHWLSRRRTS